MTGDAGRLDHADDACSAKQVAPASNTALSNAARSFGGADRSSVALVIDSSCPVARAKIVSPSLSECAGRTARASPSWATAANLVHSALVSLALVATTPIVVFDEGRRSPGSPDAARSAAVGRCRRSPKAPRRAGALVDHGSAGVDDSQRSDDRSVGEGQAGRADAALDPAGERANAGPDGPERRGTVGPRHRPEPERGRRSAVESSARPRSKITAAGTIGTTSFRPLTDREADACAPRASA